MQRALILLPHMGISVVSWIQLLLSMNRYRGVRHFSRADLWALLLFLHGGLVRWVSAMSMATENPRFQILSAAVGTTLGWVSFVVIFNAGFVFPSRQQWLAFVMSLIITTLWEVSNRLVIET